MIELNNKTSLLVPSQLPEFVRDNPDYSNFVLFLKAYYEWLETVDAANSQSQLATTSGQGVTYASKNLLNFIDVDKTLDDFLDYFVNDFLQYFPKDALLDKRKAIKFARELYQSKGTPASYEFLFKILYNSDVDIFYTKDAVLRASDGIWYTTKSLKLASTNLNFLETTNYRIFGETSKSIATIETALLSGDKIEVFISNIERLFQSGEFVRVVDSNNQDVLFGGEPLRAKLVGQVSSVKIDPKNRGLLYEVGDPVIIYGGLNSANGIGALAEVSETTTGSILRINVVNGGYGYRNYPNTSINITNAVGANAIVGSLDPTYVSHIGGVPIDDIDISRFTTIGNTSYTFFSGMPTANANTKLSDAFTTTSFDAYPISSVLVINGSSGITKIPRISATSLFSTSTGTSDLGSLGILGPIKIRNGGLGYQVNDKIVFSGGSGDGAYANVTSVDVDGIIQTVDYVNYTGNDYPLGGNGYKTEALPTLSVNSANVSASGADLYVDGVVGHGASFSAVTDRVGSITTIKLLNGGEDYVETPNVSIKVQDIVVSNVSVASLPQKDDIVFQGIDVDGATYISTVNSISLLSSDLDPLKSLYNFRVFNYNSQPNPTLELKIDGKPDINLIMANTAYTSDYNTSGVRNFGDGSAKGIAAFLNGLVISQGQYLNTRGQPSSFNVLQSDIYNNYTYVVTVEQEIAKYRDILLNLLHPTGMKVLGRMAMKANSDFEYNATRIDYTGNPMSKYTDDVTTYCEMYTDFDNKSNNTVTFYNLNGNILSDILNIGDTIEIKPENGPYIKSLVMEINDIDNQITLDSNTWLTFANVAYIVANSGSNEINITTITNSYDIINNGVYTDPTYPLKDIIFAGDKVMVANNSELTVDSIDYENGIIYTTTNLSDDANSLMSVNRTFSTTNINILGIV